MIRKEDIFVHLINMPGSTNEAVTPNEDGSYSIFINARLSNDEQLKAYEHALKHIQKEDFSKDEVQLIEAQAHNATEKEVVIPATKFDKMLSQLKKRHKETRKKMEQLEYQRKYLESIGQGYKDPDLISGLDNY